MDSSLKSVKYKYLIYSHDFHLILPPIFFYFFVTIISVFLLIQDLRLCKGYTSKIIKIASNIIVHKR